MCDLVVLNDNELTSIGGGMMEDAESICEGGFSGAGSWAGGILTSESGGWGAIPGGMLGQYVGSQMCPYIVGTKHFQ